jgi:hypothetical protein
MVKTIALAAALTAAVFSCAASANATTALFNTGVDSSGNLLTPGSFDPHWRLSGAPGVASPYVLGSPYANWYRLWPANGPISGQVSAWIGASLGNPTPPYPYTFTQTFYVANPDAVSIAGYWYSDDSATLLVNGQAITYNKCCRMESFSVPDALLKAGKNTIAVEMTWDDRHDDGVRVLFTSETGVSRLR